MNIAVIGIGQSLRGDDGIGLKAVQRWSLEFPATAGDPRVQIHLLETPGLELLEYLEDADAVILVDAVSTGRDAGTIQVVSPIPEVPPSVAEKTAHGFGITEVLALARKTGAPLPECRILIGIEGTEFGMGTGLSDSVRQALPAAVARIQEKISDLLSATTMENH
jgi:hydrogenase maturation protease